MRMVGPFRTTSRRRSSNCSVALLVNQLYMSTSGFYDDEISRLS
jgi:hypothetical protein